jgi:N-acetylglucosamine-6-sulfatase
MLCALLISLWLTLSSQLVSAQTPEPDDPASGSPADDGDVTLAARRRPNIIVILSDDHRYDYVGSLGHPFIRTPNLDALASGGVMFANSFVTTSLCSPSRASFLTGTYASTHGVRNNFTPWDPANVTFLEILAAHGYDAAFIGKWHMPGGVPELRGVDPFVTFTANDGQGRYFNCPLLVNGEPEESEHPYITTELTNRAIDFVRRKRDEPFVLYLSHKAAHASFLPPPELNGVYDDAHVELPVGSHPFTQATEGQMVHGILAPLPVVIRDYAETITAMDLEIGRILAALDDAQMTEDTLVVYTSDNGYMWGEHGLVDKRWAYDTSIRIPLIVSYPPLTIAAPDQLDQLVLNVDLAVTLLDLARVPIPAFMQGESWAPYLADPSLDGRDHFLYEYFLDFPFPVPELRAIRTRDYKLIDYRSRRPDELFRLSEDPSEERNLLEHTDAILPGLADDLREELRYLEARQ